MIKNLSLIPTLFCSLFLYTQNCSCTDTFYWLQKTIEKNDAGFQYVIDKKGRNTYSSFSEIIKNKSSNVNNIQFCEALLSEWLLFFREGHLSIQTISNVDKKQLDDEQIKQKYLKYPRYNINLESFVKTTTKGNPNGIKGVWKYKSYKIGIQKDPKSKSYIGFIIEADNLYWHPKQIKLKIFESDLGLCAEFFLRDHSKRDYRNVTLLDGNHLQTNTIIWERVLEGKELNKSESLKRYQEILSTRKPLFKIIDSETTMLRIPSFQYAQKKYIDSLLATNHSVITSKKNLIIDIRENGGGSDYAFENLLPYLYTNPIRTVGLEYLSTPLNNARMEKFINDPDWSEEDKQWASESLVTLNNNLNKFVNLEENTVDEFKLEKVFKYPKQVAILINKNNGSTAEEFILAAKQSKKVKLFGQTTQGVLDISNMNFVKSPCEKFELGYGLSRSMRIPDMSIDSKGVQPDFYIHKSVPYHKWIDYTLEILK